MKTHYYVEFLVDSLKTIRTKTDLDIEYLNYINYHNTHNEDNRAIFAIPLTWYTENKEHSIPPSLTPQHNISKELLLDGVRLAKSQELAIVSVAEYNNYIKAGENKKDYYKLQETEALNYHYYNGYSSKILESIAKNKNITVPELVEKILAKVNENQTIILNSISLVDEIKQEIAKLSFYELCRFEIIDEVKTRLFKVDDKDINSFHNPALERIKTIEEEINLLKAQGKNKK
jgi:hypothetical protein